MGIYVNDREELRGILRGLQSQGKRIVFTNGVFDLLHVGHVRSLKDAKSRGDYLVVAVNSDASARALKGPGLPLNPLKERVEVLCALSCVDYVTVIREERADDLIDFLRPDIHAKGTDYTEETVPERETVLGYGGTIAIVGDPKDHDTSGMIERLLKLQTLRRRRGGGKGRAAKKKAAGTKGAAKAAKKKAAPKSRTAKKVKGTGKAKSGTTGAAGKSKTKAKAKAKTAASGGGRGERGRTTAKKVRAPASKGTARKAVRRKGAGRGERAAGAG